MKLFKKITLLLLFAITFISFSPVAHAQTVDAQTQINALIAQINQLKLLLAQLQAQVNVNPVSCVDLQSDLHLGQSDYDSNGEIAKLQRFLGSTVTGYFGPITERAVQNWQSSHGVVSSGSPGTTGFGFVGPRTRRAMGCGVTTPIVNIDPSSLASVSGNPTLSGSASGVNSVYVSVAPNITAINAAAAAPSNTRIVVPVVNGHWSVALNTTNFDGPWNFTNNGGMFNGTYVVTVQTGTTHETLTTGMLTISNQTPIPHIDVTPTP